MSLDIYIIHAQSLGVRKNIVNELIQNLSKSGKWSKVTPMFITQHDPSEVNVELVKQMIKLDKSCDDPFFDQLIKNLHIKQISNSLKHMEALRTIATNTENGASTISLVIEDDVIFSEDIANKLSLVIEKTKKISAKWDAVYLGFPQPTSVPANQEFAKASDHFRVNPTCDAYLVTKESAKRILDSLLPIRFSTNVQMSFLAKTKGIESYFAVPNIFADGTKYGLYISTLDCNNRLFLNPDYNNLATLIRSKDTYDEKDKKAIQDALEKVRYKNHPDVIYLVALYHAKSQNYQVAKVAFDEAYKIYTQNDTIINNSSEFLMNYINLFKFLQTDI